MKIIAVIPAYNEEKTIGFVIKETKKYVDNVIVIDDGSTDNTAKIAKKNGAVIYSHPTRMGLGKTILDGYREALKLDAEIVLQIDADGQYLPKEIPKLLKPIIDNQADMVLGSRFLGTIENMPLIKKIGNKFFSKITSFLSGIKITDAQTGFRATRAEVIENIIPTGKYTYTQEMIIRASKEGYRIFEVPIYFAKRSYGKSRLIGNVFSYGSNAISIILKTFREYHPMKFFGIPGLIFIFFGTWLGYDVFSTYVLTGSMNRPGTAMLSALLIITGVLLLFIGLLADMIESKYKQIREHFKRMK
jgi:glycosyltransferase involved in cell wall biosynthesis